MNWNFTNDRPIYLQLIEQLEREIASGALKPGSWMPPVRELAGKMGISPNTVQRAMYEMERSGLLISRGTEGKTVTEDTVRIESIRQDLARQTRAEKKNGKKYSQVPDDALDPAPYPG